MIRLAIFDIAGTLIEDHNEVADSFLLALQNHGISTTEAEIKEWKGSSKREVIGHFVARQFGSCRIGPLIDQIYSEFRHLLEQRYANPGGIVPIEGAAETLEWLRARGVKLATTTGFYRVVRDRILDRLGWRDRFHAHVCSDDVEHGRPAPDMIRRAMELTGIGDPQQIVNVGDTPLDLKSAYAAGCRYNIGVLTGRHIRERLEREPHTQIVESVADLPRLLEAAAAQS